MQSSSSVKEISNTINELVISVTFQMLNGELKRLIGLRGRIESCLPLHDLRLNHIMIYVLANMDSSEEERLVKSRILVEQFVFFPQLNSNNE